MVLLVGAGAHEASAQEGQLIDSTVVTLKNDDVKELETYQRDIRSILYQVEIKPITYLSDGLKVNGDPAAAKLGRVASWGYVVVTSQSRGNAGGEGKEGLGGKDVDDLLNLLPVLRSLPRADATRIGMYGWSRGGMMTYLALARTDQIAAAIVGGALTDLADSVRRRPEVDSSVYAELIPNYAKDEEAAQTARSAIRWAEKLNAKSPILILQGGADWRAEPGEALAMASRLLEVDLARRIRARQEAVAEPRAARTIGDPCAPTNRH